MIGDISSWIISIAGVVCLSVIVELVLPDGQMNRYIKGIFSFVIILVIIMPLPSLLGKEFDFSNIFNTEEIVADDDYLYQLNLDKTRVIREEIENEIYNHGYYNVKVYINCDIFENQLAFKSITVDISNLVISENAEHKNITKIKQDITEIIQSHIKIEEREILYDG